MEISETYAKRLLKNSKEIKIYYPEKTKGIEKEEKPLIIGVTEE